jgi:hypothetical protein
MTGPGPGHGVLSAGELARLRGIGREQVSAWDQGLRAAGVPLSRALLCGSAQTGLLAEAKPARYRGSPHRPPRPRIIELDVRLILIGGADPTDARLLARIAATTGTALARSAVITRWQTAIPMAVFYAHQILTEATAIEWEVCVNVEPYFETTPYWAEVFSDSEISAQRHSRTLALRSHASRTEYELLKARQGQTFRWRLCTAIAHLPLDLLPACLQELAATRERYPAVCAMIAQARAGQLPHPGPSPWASPDSTLVAAPGWVSLLPAPD